MTGFEDVALDHDGAALVGALARPEGAGPHPAVLVMHTAHGLGDFVRDRARRLAGHGFVALATDMYGGGRHFDDASEAGEPFLALQQNPDRLRARVAAWYEALKAVAGVDPARVAAIGFCFGGQCVLELARSGADVKAVVSYHGLLSTAAPAAPGAIAGRVTVYHGAKDPFVPADTVDAFRREMAGAGVRLQFTSFSEAAHGFTDPDIGRMVRAGIAYDEEADRVSWAGTLALLEMVKAGA
jgi:dienelactone hydrolase